MLACPQALPAGEDPMRARVEAAQQYWMYTHAVLMSLAFVGLMPREGPWLQEAKGSRQQGLDGWGG